MSQFILFFDTETSGLPKDYKAPVTDLNNWPRLVQLGMIITDEDGGIITENEWLVRPPLDFMYDPQAVATHHITEARATVEGSDLVEVLRNFLGYASCCQTVVGHNVDFDIAIVSAEILRCGLVNTIETMPRFCTMKSTTDLIRLPSKYRGTFKYPKLEELYHFLFGKEMGAAHTALQDIQNTMSCYQELKRRGIA
jgi:DNA polymerase III epsilon subunit-like protein